MEKGRVVRDKKNIHAVCQLCGALEKLMICGGCRSTWYCSKEHQKYDWKYHKKNCKLLLQKKETISENERQSSKHMQAVVGGLRDDNGVHVVINKEGRNTLQCSPRDLSHESHIDVNNTTRTQNETSGKKNVASVNSALMSHLSLEDPENFHLSNESEEGNSDENSFQSYFLESNETVLKVPVYDNTCQNILKSDSNMSPPAEQDLLDKSQTYFSVLQARNEVLGNYVVKCLNQYGICVIDNFLGEGKGMSILDEVKALHAGDVLREGQLVSNKSGSSSGHIRGDLITWIDGCEERCKEIQFLISSMDAVILQCGGKLSNCSINGRTKAMVACYPGKETGYVRHIDNPNRDGRCVTCIYYLNKDWNSQKDGGILRIFPEASNTIACIEPKLDRLLFFWSDRRNPHEVMPTTKTRYAITVWYYDAVERQQAVSRFKENKM